MLAKENKERFDTIKEMKKEIEGLENRCDSLSIEAIKSKSEAKPLLNESGTYMECDFCEL